MGYYAAEIELCDAETGQISQSSFSLFRPGTNLRATSFIFAEGYRFFWLSRAHLR
jgi:hypothetical protein